MRVPSTTDRRAVLVSLTNQGRALVSEVATAFEADVLVILDSLPASDLAALSTLVSKVLVAHAGSRGIDLFAVEGAAGQG